MEIQLVPETGARTTKKDQCIDLYVGADGSVRLSGYELGPSVRMVDDDYEYHVNVSAAAVPNQVFARFARNFGPKGAVQEFRVL
jgi:hypothetical protein